MQNSWFPLNQLQKREECGAFDVAIYIFFLHLKTLKDAITLCCEVYRIRIECCSVFFVGFLYFCNQRKRVQNPEMNLVFFFLLQIVLIFSSGFLAEFRHLLFSEPLDLSSYVSMIIFLVLLGSLRGRWV